MSRSCAALHPYWEVTRAQGESSNRLLTATFSTLSPNAFFMNSVSPASAVEASSTCNNRAAETCCYSVAIEPNSCTSAPCGQNLPCISRPIRSVLRGRHSLI